jgi:hypothetical protein
MLLRNIFNSGSAAVAEQWDSSEMLSSPDSLKKQYLAQQPDSPSSPVSGELISTAVPSDIASAADHSSSSSSSSSPTAAKAALGPGARSGFAGGVPALDLAGASFGQLCNDGSQWTWANWRVKVYRWTLLCIKQVYLIWLAFMSVPTNHLMVRRLHAPVGGGGGGGGGCAVSGRGGVTRAGMRLLMFMCTCTGPVRLLDLVLAEG